MANKEQDKKTGKESQLENLLKYDFVWGLCFLASWTMPNHILPWVSWYNELFSFTSLVLLYFVIQSFDKSQRVKCCVWNVSNVELWFLIILVVVAIQTIAGSVVYAGDGLVLFIYLGAAILSVRLGRRGADKIHLLACLIAMSALVSVLIAIVQAFEISLPTDLIVQSPSYRRPGANLAQSNHLGTLLL